MTTITIRGMMSEEQIAAIEQFAARVKTYYTKLGGSIPSGMVVYYIDQVVEEYKKRGE
jgi:hypothetical protein